MNLKPFYWNREPKSYSVTDDQVVIESKPFTDFWQRTYYGIQNDNCPVFQMDTEETHFSFVTKVSFRDSHVRYNQCGVAIYLDSDNWFKAAIEYENEEYQNLGCVVTNHGYSDWSTMEIPLSTTSLWFRLSRRNQDFKIEYSEDGERFHQLRMFHLHAATGKIPFGIFACSADDGSFTATFSQMKLTECQWPAP